MISARSTKDLVTTHLLGKPKYIGFLCYAFANAIRRESLRVTIAMTPGQPPCLLVLIPIFNDWDAVSTLLEMLERALLGTPHEVDVLLVDDASPVPLPVGALVHGWTAIKSIRVLRLRRNLGHQRAIAVGLTYARQHIAPRGILVMDGDGEDGPGDAVRLLDEFERHQGAKCVFAERRRRAEGLLFRSLYFLYRSMHFLLTGERVKVGNFSVIPAAVVDGLVVSPDLWNHYAATAFHGRFPRTTIHADRQKRIAGQSKMNLVSLVAHGLRAMSVYSDVIGVRLLLAASVGVVAVVLILAAAFAFDLPTHVLIPTWGASAVGFMMVVLIQMVSLSLMFAFLALLHGRGTAFVPDRDCSVFVGEVTEVATR